MTTAWHVDDAALQRWVDGTDGSVAGASVEQHLITCASCRERVPADPVVDQVWARVQDAIEVPKQSLLERFLLRLGLTEADARIVAVSPAFRGAWLGGLTALLGFVTVAGGYGASHGQLVFLVVAPLVPALAVAMGYDPELDEALESECAAPYNRLRLVLLRSVALLVVAIPAFVIASLLLPGSIAFWWLAPAAGCTAAVLALSTWVVPLTATGIVGTVWLMVVSTVSRQGAVTDVVGDDYLVVYAAISVAGVLLFVARRSRLAWGTR
jgi:hypothetical protein